MIYTWYAFVKTNHNGSAIIKVSYQARTQYEAQEYFKAVYGNQLNSNAFR
jgi:hypothetical protein